MQRFIEVSEKLNTISVGIFIKEKLVAFIINELTHNDYAIIHFDKSDIAFVGISSYMRQVSAKILNEKGYTHINFEQDLGIIGLREAKQQLRPAFFLKKYLITQRNGQSV